jgi:hypothetical protein
MPVFHKPKPRVYKPARSSEYNEQVALFQYLRMSTGVHPEYEFVFAVPNGAKLSYRRSKSGNRYSPEAIKLLKSGLTPGVSDIVIPCMRGGYGAMFLELKYGKNTVSPEQQAFIEAMIRFGYFAIVAWGADEAIRIIETYMNGAIKKP